MPVSPGALDELRETIDGDCPRPQLNGALDMVGTVHSTRFVILEDEEGSWAKLIVVAIYDGTADDYIAAFANRAAKAPSTTLFPFISDHPKLNVEEQRARSSSTTSRPTTCGRSTSGPTSRTRA